MKKICFPKKDYTTTVYFMKYHNKVVYLYLRDSNLLKKYFDESGNALYPKYNEPLKKLLIETIKYVKKITKYKEQKRIDDANNVSDF